MFDAGIDQAAGLRKRMAAPPLALMAFPSSEGGDHSWIAQLAHSMRAMGAKPVVIDASRGAVVARAFGLRLRHELLELLQGTADFDTVAQVTRDGIHVLRAERGIEAFVASGAPARDLFAGFARLSHGFDSVLLVMPACELACLAGPAQAVPVVALAGGDEGLVNTYATVKQLAAGFGYSRFAVVTCGRDDAGQARDAHARLAMAARTFLNAEVSFAGALPPPGHAGQVGQGGLGGRAAASLASNIAALSRTLLHTAALRLTPGESLA